MDNEGRKSYGVPVAIVLAGLLVAAAIYYQPEENTGNQPVPPNDDLTANQALTALRQMKPISAADHRRGSLNAPVKIVEYSDLECPFCKAFQQAMQKLVTKYNADQLVWIYRHYPLDGRHPKARREAEASECIARLGSEEKFWQFIDKIFEITPSNDGLDPAKLGETAVGLGINRSAFDQCLESGQSRATVENSVQDGTKIGLDGTPFVVVSADNQAFTLFHNQEPANLQTSTKAIINDLENLYQETIQTLR